MAQMLTSAPARRTFARADILSRLGETVFVAELAELSRYRPEPKQRAEVRPPVAPPIVPVPEAWDEDPERWDGLS